MKQPRDNNINNGILYSAGIRLKEDAHDAVAENNYISYYYLYQAIWPINKSVYLILSDKSTRMRPIF